MNMSLHVQYKHVHQHYNAEIEIVIIMHTHANGHSAADLQRGECRFLQAGNLSMTAWRDTKAVFLMSTLASPTSTTTVRRKGRDGSSRDVPCPESIALYNRHMGGVDKADQLRGFISEWCPSLVTCKHKE